jgi:gliding motility-associated-like protein
MKHATLVFLLLLSLPVFAQKEANNWFFGRNAGIQFLDDGSVEPLPGSLMRTNEGCSSYSDPDGNLLFYTDGRNIWDRNHVLMPNANYILGRGLLGDPSSTQSAIIIPKKNDPNIYYVFTVDEPHHENAATYPDQFLGPFADGGFVPADDDGFNNGLNYSVIDLSVTGTNGSIGDVTTRNVQLFTYDPANPDEAKYKCSEKVTAVKNSDGTGFWVVTQFIDKFYSFLVNQNGVTETPVVTQITPVVPVEGYRRNAIGCIKASPDGRYLGIAHQQLGTATAGSENNGVTYLYDFNNATGVLSNPVVLNSGVNPYGIEFSPEVKKVYVSLNNGNRGEVRQYDMLNPDIQTSEIIVATNNGSTTLQLGPNGKIYRAVNGAAALDVINNPEEDGALCNYESGGVSLPAGMTSVFGLPPFITSLFSARIAAVGTCFNQVTTFRLQANSSFDTVVWNFGDGTPATTVAEPQHLYAAAGIYNVTAAVTKDGITEQVSQEITISATPVANTPPNVTGCDTDDDGFMTFDFTPTTTAILGTQSSTDFTVRYFTTATDAESTTRPLNTTMFTNTSNPQTVFARVQNAANASCYDVTSFQVSVGGPLTLGSTAFAICDDAQDGNDANGQATFNFNDVTAQLVQTTGYSVTYYTTDASAQAETAGSTLAQSFYNTTPNVQVVYARIVNTLYPACFSVVPVTLTVNALPDNVVNASLTQCGLGNAFAQFNLTEADAQFTNGSTDLAVTYYPSVTNAENNTNVITGTYTNTANPQIAAKVTNTVTGCYRILPLTLTVTNAVVAPLFMERCDDDGTEDGLAEFVLTDLGLETPFTTVVYYATQNDALLEQNPVSSTFTTTVANLQRVFARIETNNSCTAIQEIVLNVYPLPNIEIADTDVVCLNTRDFITIDAGTNGNANYRYRWSTGAETRTINVNTPGLYTVVVTDVTHPSSVCSKVRTVTVLPSNVARIDEVIVEDLRDNNTITIVASPMAGTVSTTYLYSLDLPNGPWQTAPYFSNVEAGIHTVYVYDDSGCGVTAQQVAVLSIPKFFTPNGDSANDYWRIAGLNAPAYLNSGLYIYDRYGKLITSVDPNSAGWNGMLNGSPLPATDYWYVLSLPDGRVVKGHFSLLR